MQLPDVKPEKISEAKSFITNLQQPYYLLDRSSIESKYKKLDKVFSDTFWESIKEANISHDRPADFDSFSTWEQIMWIRVHGLPTAWKLLKMLEEKI